MMSLLSSPRLKGCFKVGAVKPQSFAWQMTCTYVHMPRTLLILALGVHVSLAPPPAPVDAEAVSDDELWTDV